MNYEIRRFKVSDSAQTSELLISAFEWFHKGDRKSWLYRSFEPKKLTQISKTLEILVAIADDEIVGYISSNNSIYGVAYIPTVAVHPSRQRYGLGKKLVEHKLKILKEQGMRKVWLLVTSINVPAITFYLKQGFVIEGYLRNHTGPGLDEILFSKFLI